MKIYETSGNIIFEGNDFGPIEVEKELLKDAETRSIIFELILKFYD